MQPQPSDHTLFDTLIVLRELYVRRGSLDREAGLSIDGAVIYGEGLMRIARRRDEQAARRRSTQAE
jgi:hypothetical protein